MSGQPNTCANCGAPLSAGARFCENCGTPVAQAMVPAAPGSDVAVVPGYQSSPMMPIYAGADPLLEYVIEYPERLSRWKIFVKWLLAIPHYFILTLLGIAIYFVGFVAFFAILITARFPRGLWDFNVLFLRWSANVAAYAYLLQRDEYPPFGEGPYPVTLNLLYPERLSRWKIFFKWLFVIPHLIVLGFLSIALMVVLFIAFFAILITARYPRGLFDFVVGFTRWSNRVTAYTSLMTDKYPPFGLD